MEAIITSTEYVNGNRVTVQNVTYTKSEDVRTLGNLYNQLSMVLARIETASDEAIIEMLIKERKSVEDKIQEQEAIIAGYPEEE